MNNGQQGAQPTQGQPNGQQPAPRMFRPEQMRALPDSFPEADKLKWEQGLRQLWHTIENNDKTTQAHLEAKRKLFEFSRTLTQKLQSAMQARARAQPNTSQSNTQQGQSDQAGQSQIGAQNQQATATRPSSQGQQEQSQASGGGMNNGNQAAGQQGRPAPKISPKLLEHVNSFPYVNPPTHPAGTPTGDQWLRETKSKYLKALVSMEGGASRVQTIEALTKTREAEGRPLSSEEQMDFKEKKEVAQSAYNDAKRFVDHFRQSQNVARNNQGANNSSNPPQPATSNTNATSNNAGPAPVRPGMSMQQNPNPALQNTQAISAAIEAAKNQQNQQMGGNRPQMSQPGQMPSQSAPSQGNMGQQPGQSSNIKQEAGVPAPINTAITSMQGNQNRPMQNSPQSANPRSAGLQQSAPSQQPQALSHQDALNQAARTYSNTAPASTVMGAGHTHPQQIPREPNLMTNKMPIPKHLPERATAAPSPVNMGPSRPTYSGGPSNAGNGVLGQPVLTKAPPFTMEGEGDRVLSKKKLDELVRQVTGGGGLENGEALAPDVEESVLNMADNFLDQVLQSACKNAKERGSKSLEIRDIQLTLERGYNIRIPGYASDEIRTVRKIVPTNQWINKMSAVTASKVTGGKNTD